VLLCPFSPFLLDHLDHLDRSEELENMVDVDMKPAAADATATAASTEPKKEPITPKELVLLLLRHNLHLIVRSVIHLEPRFAARAVRTVSSTRKLCHLHPDVMARLVEEGTEKGESKRTSCWR
jgi:26S proteasome regulatory subunit N3